MPRHRSFFSLLVVGAVLAMPAAAQQVGVHWQQDIESAKASARETGRLVLIHFWTPSCGPCMMLNQNVFNQPGVGTALEAQFVPVKLNANENSATATGFGITRVPTDVIITPDGEVVGKLISPPTPSGYIAELSQIANQYTTRSGQAYASAVAAAPFERPPFINPAYASLQFNSAVTAVSPAPAASPVSTQTASAAPAPAAAIAPALPAAGTNYNSVPFQAPGSSPATALPASYAAVQQPPVNRYAALGNAGQASMPTGVNSVPTAAAPVAANVNAAPTQPTTTQRIAPPAIAPPAIVANRYAAAPSAASGLAPASPATSQLANPYIPTAPQAAAAVPAPQPSPADVAAAPTGPPDPRRLPPGAPPLGFDGYCPVSMRNSNLTKWVPGDPRYGIVHRDRTYWFAGPQEQQQFWSHPDYYTPALSGIDPVLAIDHKQQVPGRREHSLDYDNLFYLFSSEATLQQFAANPERYAVGIRQAMGIQRGRIVR